MGSSDQNLGYSKTSFLDAKKDFQKAYQSYAELSDKEALQTSQLLNLANDFFKQGEFIFTYSQNLFSAIQERSTLLHELIEVQIDNIIQPLALKDPQLNVIKQQATFEIEINMHELISAVSGYLLMQDDFHLARLKDSQEDLNRWLKVYQEQPLNDIEMATIQAIIKESRDIGNLSTTIIDTKQKLQIESVEFEQLYRQLHAVLNDNLQPKEMLAYKQRFEELNDLIYIISTFLVFMIIASTIVIRNTTRPIISRIEALKQSTKTFQKNQQIDLPKVKNDELGELNYDLEKMMLSLNAHTLELQHMANYDSLTGLPNRILLADRLNLAISRNKRTKSMVCVLFIDLDGFKAVNDTYGHEVGDILLMNIAKDLKNHIRESDTLSRIGGDEFIALLPNINNKTEIIRLLNKLLPIVSTNRIIENYNINVSASIGVNMVKANSKDDADQVVRKADIAMYQAKQAGKNQFHIFDDKEDNSIRAHKEQLNIIEAAIQNQEFTLFYQPKINMSDGKVIGLEALIRWQHPEQGLLSPAAFLPLIQDHPLLIKIGDWVMAEAIKQNSEWQKQGVELGISINVEAIQLAQGNFVTKLQKILEQHPNINPQNIELEMLETSALENNNRFHKIFSDCQKMGIKLALDDFGTGYSTLSYLKKVPANVLKIDQSFVKDILLDSDDLAIIEGIIRLSETFSLDVIADGVETIEQGMILKMLGCELAQGYCIAKPMPASEVMPWLTAWTLPKEWQNSSILQTQDRAIIYAIAEHNKWIHQLTLYAQKLRNSPPPLEPDACNFSTWLDKQPSSAEIDEINLLHKKIHLQAKELVNATHKDSSNSVDNKIQAIELKKVELITKLFKLGKM